MKVKNYHHISSSFRFLSLRYDADPSAQKIKQAYFLCKQKFSLYFFLRQYHLKVQKCICICMLSSKKWKDGYISAYPITCIIFLRENKVATFLSITITHCELVYTLLFKRCMHNKPFFNTLTFTLHLTFYTRLRESFNFLVIYTSGLLEREKMEQNRKETWKQGYYFYY